ncbi:MAG: hypothetical protein KAH38_10310, partial [Candidatus Hydrogenedentes bacterium]|nr:hypothetical protein [Candidatus Hydrogenedentota bacterium]
MDEINKEQGSSKNSSIRLTPLRGIIPARNAGVLLHDITTLRKWIRLNSVVFKVDRIDLLLAEEDVGVWVDLCDFATTEQVVLSPRITVSSKPEVFATLLENGIHDLCLDYDRADLKSLEDWLHLAKEKEIPVRVRVLPVAISEDVERLAVILADACAVSVDLNNPFLQRNDLQQEERAAWVARMNTLTRLLGENRVDVALTGLPFCHVEENNLPYAMNSRQFFSDHLQYHKDSFVFAERVFRFGSGRVSKAIENQLARKTSLHNLIDASLFPWIMDYPRFYIRVWMFHKLTRHLPFMHRDLRPLPENLDAYENELQKYQKLINKEQGAVCSLCRFCNVCDRETR